MLPFQSVLCALDFSPGCTRALVSAADLAERAHARLHLLHVAPLFRARLAGTPTGDLDAAFEHRARAFVNEALGATDAFEVLAPELHHVHGQAPADGILDCAERTGADAIVVGTHGRTGLPHLILGSVAEEVIRRATVPVVAVPERASGFGPGPDRPVLVPIDLTETTRTTLGLADALATAYDAPLVLLHALEDPVERPEPTAEAFTPESLGAAADVTPRTVAHLALSALADETTATVASKHVAYELAELLVERLMKERNAGAVVMGTHGRTGAARVLLGSVAEWAVRHATCPVVTLTAAAMAAQTPLAARSASA